MKILMMILILEIIIVCIISVISTYWSVKSYSQKCEQCVLNKTPFIVTPLAFLVLVIFIFVAYYEYE